MSDNAQTEEKLEFKTRRLVAAVRRGDRKTVAALAGQDEAANIDWMMIKAQSVAKLARSLLNDRVHAELNKAYSRPSAIMRPAAKNASTSETLIDTIADFMMSGQLDRIRHLAVHVARTTSLDHRAREVLAGRIEHVHTLALAHRLQKEYRPAHPKVTIQGLPAWELAENHEAPARMNDLQYEPNKETNEAAVHVIALATRENAANGRDYRVSVRENTPFEFMVTAEGFGAHRAIAGIGGDEDQRAPKAITRAMNLGLCSLYEEARLRPVKTGPIVAIALKDATTVTKNTVAVELTNDLLASFVEHTSRTAECTRADIVAIATEWGLEQIGT